MKKLILFLAIGMNLISCDKPMTAEEWLAADDAGAPIRADDIKVNQIRALLQDLSSVYKEPKDTIARYTNLAKKALNQGYIDVVTATNLSVLEEMNKMPVVEGVSYKEAVFDAMNKLHAVD